MTIMGMMLCWVGRRKNKNHVDVPHHVLLMTIKIITNNYDNYAKWFNHWRQWQRTRRIGSTFLGN